MAPESLYASGLSDATIRGEVALNFVNGAFCGLLHHSSQSIVAISLNVLGYVDNHTAATSTTFH